MPVLTDNKFQRLKAGNSILPFATRFPPVARRREAAQRYGYARVSTDGQTRDAQLKQLRAAGAGKVFKEIASGAKTDRAQLRRVIGQLEKGDVLTVTRLDRLACSTRDLLNTAERVALRLCRRRRWQTGLQSRAHRCRHGPERPRRRHHRRPIAGAGRHHQPLGTLSFGLAGPIVDCNPVAAPERVLDCPAIQGGPVRIEMKR
jgi:Resolvase, N terminal domain